MSERGHPCLIPGRHWWLTSNWSLHVRTMVQQCFNRSQKPGFYVKYLNFKILTSYLKTFKNPMWAIQNILIVLFGHGLLFGHRWYKNFSLKPISGLVVSLEKGSFICIRQNPLQIESGNNEGNTTQNLNQMFHKHGVKKVCCSKPF